MFFLFLLPSFCLLRALCFRQDYGMLIHVIAEGTFQALKASMPSFPGFAVAGFRRFRVSLLPNSCLFLLPASCLLRALCFSTEKRDDQTIPRTLHVFPGKLRCRRFRVSPFPGFLLCHKQLKRRQAASVSPASCALTFFAFLCAVIFNYFLSARCYQVKENG